MLHSSMVLIVVVVILIVLQLLVWYSAVVMLGLIRLHVVRLQMYVIVIWEEV